MRLAEKYQKQIRKELKEKLGLKSIMAVPRIEKVVVNSGFGKAIEGESGSVREKTAEYTASRLALITGQRPSLRKAKKSISSFHLRKGMAVGASVTLRGKMMYQFLEKLIYLVLPRKRDFRGIPLKSISKGGSLTIGFKEYTPFPDVKIDKEKQVFGLSITIAVNARSRKEAIELFKAIGLPLQKET